jgi:hypothetical protein
MNISRVAPVADAPSPLRCFCCRVSRRARILLDEGHPATASLYVRASDRDLGRKFATALGENRAVPLVRCCEPLRELYLLAIVTRGLRPRGRTPERIWRRTSCT